MAVKQYDIIFKGETVDGVDVQVAKQALANLFKLSDDKVEALFTGKPIVLKRDLPFAMANKYRVAIKKAGSLAEVVESTVDTTQSESVSNAPKSSEVRSDTDKNVPNSNLSKKVSDLIEKVRKPSEESSAITAGVDTVLFQVLPVGASLTDASNDHVVTDVDVSHLSLRENQGLLVDESEREAPEAVTVDTSLLSMGQVGDNVLNEDERAKPVESTVDVSHLALDASDKPLETSRHVNQSKVDTSHLSLV